MTRGTVWRIRIFVAAVVLIIGVLLLQGVRGAEAHESWINSSGAKSVDGTHCCGTTGPNPDCSIVPASDMQSTVGGWLIKPTGEVVPYGESQQSEDQDFWRCKRWDGTRRCFFAPPQGF